MKQARWKAIFAVVPDPFASEQLAASKAAAIARRCGARLVLFNTFMVPQPAAAASASGEQIIAREIRRRRQALRKIAAGLRQRSAVKCIVEWDFPAHEAIVRQVLKLRPDLLVTESHRHGRLARWVLANTDWELIRSCPCPVWFARAPQLPRRLRVLVAVDPRHTHAKPARLDDRMLQTARQLTDQLGGRISVVHAYDTPASALPGMLMEPVRLPISPQRTRQFVAQLRQDVTKLGQKYAVDASQCYVEEGAPGDVIAALARLRGADVLMMGAVSRSMLVRPVIGSTAERVIDHVECDVFIVKPAGFRTPVGRRPARLPAAVRA